MQVGLKALTPAALVALLLVASCRYEPSLPSLPLQRVRVSQFRMGMMVHLTLWAPTVEQGRRAAKLAFERIAQIDRIMSDYDPDSELSRLCRRSGQGAMQVSSELFFVLAAARRLAQWTQGRYDPTVGPLSRLWRNARKNGKFPSPAEIEMAVSQVGYSKMLLDRTAKTVELTEPGMWLDLGSIAKGYAGDEAIRILSERGIQCAAYEAGGDKVFGSAPPGESGWRVDTSPFQPKLPPLANCAVSISSDAVQHIEHEGNRVGHVIDPRTGTGFSPHLSCVVVSPRGIESDPLATIGITMSEKQFQEFLAEHFPNSRATFSKSQEDDRQEKPRIPPP